MNFFFDIMYISRTDTTAEHRDKQMRICLFHFAHEQESIALDNCTILKSTPLTVPVNI